MHTIAKLTRPAGYKTRQQQPAFTMPTICDGRTVSSYFKMHCAEDVCRVQSIVTQWNKYETVAKAAMYANVSFASAILTPILPVRAFCRRRHHTHSHTHTLMFKNRAPSNEFRGTA